MRPNFQPGQKVEIGGGRVCRVIADIDGMIVFCKGDPIEQFRRQSDENIQVQMICEVFATHWSAVKEIHEPSSD